MQSNKTTKKDTNNKDGDGKKVPTTTTTSNTDRSSSTSSNPDTSPSSKTKTTATTPPTPTPQATYAENLTCCVCMDELPVDDATFTRMACCGKAMHQHCFEGIMKSKMSQAQKRRLRCPQCRQKFPT